MKEAVMWVILAVCILLFISFFGIGGYVGEVISDICFGIFGLSAYVFPILIFVAAAFLISNRGSRIAGIKFISAVFLYLCLCSFAGLFTGQYEEIATLTGLYEDSAAYHWGGGILGGGICHFLCPALGAVGTAIVLLIVTIICMVLITQKSLMRSMKRQSTRMYQNARESSARRREAHMQERQRQEEWKHFEQKTLETGDSPDQQQPAAQGTDSRHKMQQRYPRAVRDQEPLMVERVAPNTRRRGRGAQIYGESQMSQNGGLEQYSEYDDTTRHSGDQPSGINAGTKRTGMEQNVGRAPLAGVTLEPDIPTVRPARSGRTELEVPVIFPTAKRESRLEHRVSGVSMNTKLEGDPTAVPADTREIRPEAVQPNGMELQQDTCYIDLGDNEPEKIPDTVRTVTRTSESGNPKREPELSFHIEGIEPETEYREPAAEKKKSSIGSDMETRLTELAERMQGIPEEEECPEYPELRTADAEVPDTDAYENENAAVDRADEEETFASHRAAKVHRSDFGADIFRDDSNGAAPSSAGTVFRAEPKRTIKTDAEGQDGEVQEKEETSVPSRRNPRSSEKEIAEGIADVEAEMAKAAEAVKPEYVYPPIELLEKGQGRASGGQEQEIRQTAAKLQQTLESFGVNVTVTNVSCGPSVTRYEILPEMGVKVSKIVSLSDDIKMNLAAADIRIEAPIPGKMAVGIEVPNKENSSVALRDLIETDEFMKHPSKIAFATGKDIGGRPVVSDIAKMPHLLIAGATGSGKSVCINTIIMSILYKAHPDEVKLIMIDPKVVELSVYNGIPHLFIPVVTDPKKAAGALNWAVAEMTDRYNKFAEYGVRNLAGYNKKIEALDDVDDPNKPKKLPQIVIIVDELADLMMVAPGEVEDAICRLAQLARACGIHLIIATQRPSVNVITGLIKANMPSRIAFAVSSGVDSRTILDMNGAEKLLGKGDMLYAPQGKQKPDRVQGAFVSDDEVAAVVDFLKNKNTNPSYNADMQAQIAKVQHASAAAKGAEDTDALFADAGRFIIDKDKASIGMLQRVFKIGFNRAARIMDQLSDAGVVGPEEGTKPRKILMSSEQFENYLEEN